MICPVNLQLHVFGLLEKYTHADMTNMPTKNVPITFLLDILKMGLIPTLTFLKHTVENWLQLIFRQLCILLFQFICKFTLNS